MLNNPYLDNLVQLALSQRVQPKRMTGDSMAAILASDHAYYNPEMLLTKEGSFGKDMRKATETTMLIRIGRFYISSRTAVYCNFDNRLQDSSPISTKI